MSIAPTSSVARSDLKSGAQLSSTSKERQIVIPNDYVKALELGTASSAVGRSVILGLTDVLGSAHEVTATIVGVSNPSLLNSGAGANTSLVNELATQQRAGVKGPARYQVAVAHFAAGLSPPASTH